MDKLDFETVKSAALAHADGLLAEWLPSGRYDRHEYVALNPTRADKHAGSFRINTRKGSWADFATDDKGGDLVSLYAYLFGVSQGDALRAVAERLRIGNFAVTDKQAFTTAKKARNSWTPILPVDERYLASMPTSHYFKDKGRQQAERISLYRDADGRVLGAVMRFRHADGSKDDVPCTFCRDQQGNMMWRFRGFDEPRPLYGLDALAAKPNAPVLLVEGEKCKDAAAACADLADYVAVSWCGGVNGWKKTDWQPLAGRQVVCWADCDSQRRKLTKKDEEDGLTQADMPYLPADEQPGMAAMLAIAEQLAVMGCTVSFVRVPEAGVWACGYDVADLLEDDVPPVALQAALSDLRSYPFVDDAVGFPAPSENTGVSANAHPHGAGGGTAGNGKTLLQVLLDGYAQIGLKERVISLETGEILSRRQLERNFGKQPVMAWFYHAKRQKLAEFEADTISKRLKLEALAKQDDFANVLERYIYLDGTTDAFDIKLDCVVSLAAVKAAIPDQFDDWSKSAARLVCPIKNYVFEPALPAGISFNSDNEDIKMVNYINMFRGLPVQAIWEKAPINGTLAEIKEQFPNCRHIIGLVEHLCSGNGDKAEQSAIWVLNWLACRFRQPEIKPATALVFISEVQGVGKSTFGERVIKSLFGDYTRQLDQNALESRFNSALAFALVTIFEEISPSDERMNIIGKLKNMITSDVVMIERKGRDPEKFSDYNSFVIFTNDEKSIPMEANDRRFMVSSCDKKFTDAQYQALDAEINNNGIEAFAEFLYALPLKYVNDGGELVPFTPHSKPLMTNIKRRMININRPGWEAFFDDWRHGDLGLPFVSCAAKDLWAAYKYWCADTKTFSMNKKNFYANISKRLTEYRTFCKIGEESKNLRIFAVPYERMSEWHQQRYTKPNTHKVSRSGDGGEVVSTAEYFGRQLLDFNQALRGKIPHHDQL